MNISNALRSITLALGIVGALFHSVPAAQAQATAAQTEPPSNEGCSAAALRGTYVVSFSGQGTLSPPQFSESDFFPITVIGTYTFGGNGIVNRALTVSAAALPPFPVSGPGSYQVAADCSGTIEFPANSETFTIYIVDEHRVEITATTAGRLGAGVLLKQEIHHCSNESLSGTFVFTAALPSMNSGIFRTRARRASGQKPPLQVTCQFSPKLPVAAFSRSASLHCFWCDRRATRGA